MRRLLSLLALGALLFLVVAGVVQKRQREAHDAVLATLPLQQLDHATPLAITGESVKTGIADASIEYGPDGTGWMAYSFVDFRSIAERYVETHLATSSNGGATWSFVGALNASARQSKNGAVAGTMRYETPSLVYDGKDDPGRRWKVYAQRYISPVSHPDRYTENRIVRWEAPSPRGPWSSEECVIGESAECTQRLSSLSPDLEGMVFFNELGVLALGETLFLSFDVSPSESGVGSPADLRRRSIRLLRSEDHGRTWRHAGVLTDWDDATHFGYRTFTASSLVLLKGQPHLFITPSGSLAGENKAHDGTYIIPFDDIATATLHRDGGGTLIPRLVLVAPPGRGGQADYDERNLGGGLVVSRLAADAGKIPFQLLNTAINPTDE